jgi:hypothetical protein
MKVPWPHDRCIACGNLAVLTEEHLIPQSLGGRLTADFLCKSCNDDLGRRIEALAKKDPAIVLAIRNFEARHPEQARRLADGMDLIVHSEGGSSRARRRGNSIRVRAHQLPDGSLVQPTDDARESVRRILEKQGTPPTPLEDALRKFDSAPSDERVEIAPGLEIVKWTILRIQPDPSGTPLNPLLPLKIAFEFLACHLGAAIYDSVRPLEVIRESLRSGALDESVHVEFLRAEREQPLHGLLFEGNDPYARVQVRLFGNLAYRVHFKNLAVGGMRFVYTHLLESDEEDIAEAT